MGKAGFNPGAIMAMRASASTDGHRTSKTVPPVTNAFRFSKGTTFHRELRPEAYQGTSAIKAAEALLGKLQEKTPEERRKEAVATEGVKQSIYLGYIHRELSNESACLELPLTIIMFLCFSVFAIFMLRQDQIFAVEDAMRFDIVENANFAWAHNFGHKNLEDVNSIADLWSWLRLGYLPLIVQTVWPYSEDYPGALGTHVYDGTSYGDAYGRPTGPAAWLLEGYDQKAPIKNDYLRYTRIIGGIKLHQTIAEASRDLCRLPSGVNQQLMESWLGKPCAPHGDGVLTPELSDSESFDENVRTEWLFPELDSMEELQRAMIDMEDGCTHAAATGNLEQCRCETCRSANPRQPYVDEQTRRLEVAFVTFNAQYGVYSYVGTNLFFNRGGHIFKHINIMSAWSDIETKPPEELYPMLVSGAVWVILLLKIIVGEIRELFAIVRASKEGCWKAIRQDYIGLWNAIDWGSLLLGCAMIFVFMEARNRVTTVTMSLQAMMGASTRAREGSIAREEYKSLTESFFDDVESMVLMENWFRLLVMFYPGILMLRLFKSFAAQPRLAIVTKTLERATEDLIHFSIVFVCVFLCMVLNSILFFGQDLEDFSTLPRAVNSCFRAMFGDWDFSAMQEIGLIKAQLWFWSFMLLMVLILLNMLLAVIMDAYTEEKARAKTAQSLVLQSLDMYRRFRQYRRGERVRLNDIWDVFEKEYSGDVKAMLADERLLTAAFLTERVPKMASKQATRTLEKSLATHEDAIEAEVTDETRLDSIKDRSRRCEERCEMMLEAMHHMTTRVQYYDRMQATGDPEYDFHFGGEDRSELEASAEAVSQAVTELSQEVCGIFVENLKGIESWQDSFERQQNELHGLIAEMQIMVRQQAWCVAAMSEAVSQLSMEGDALLASGSPDGGS